MKIFFYIQNNPKNKSGISSKIWKIERKARTVTVWWGHCIFDPSTRKPVPNSKLVTKQWSFKNEEEAREAEKKRISEKLREGYERSPRRKA